MRTSKDALLCCSRWVVGTTVLALLGLGGCEAPRKAHGPSPAWDQTRLSAMLQLADEQIGSGKFVQARETLGMFHDASDVRLVCALTRVDVEEGNYEAALRRLDALPPEAGAATASQRLRGVALEGLGRWPAAAVAYQSAYTAEPAVELLVAWVDALILSGQSSFARDVLELERGRFPGQPAIQVLAAELYQRDGDHAEAIRELTTAGLAEPRSPEIRRRLAEAYTAAGRWSDAIELWRALLADSPAAGEEYALRSRLAACLTRAGAAVEAREMYAVLAAAKPEDDAVATGMAAASLLAGEPAKALDAALTVLQRHPENVDARLLAALSYRRLHQPAKAEALLSDTRGSGDAVELAQKLLKSPH